MSLSIQLYSQPSRLLCQRYVRKHKGAEKNVYDGLENSIETRLALKEFVGSPAIQTWLCWQLKYPILVKRKHFHC